MKTRPTKNQDTCQSVFALLLSGTAVFVLCTALLLLWRSIRQTICAIGVFSEELPAGACTQSISRILSGASPDAYQAGIDALRQAGYEGSYLPLFLRQFLGILLFLAIVLLLLFALCAVVLKRRQRIRAFEIQQVVHWANNAEPALSEPIAAREIPAPVIDTILSLKQQLKQQKIIYEENTAQVLHYMENISHQLKTPLAVIRAICENLSLRIPETEEKMASCLAQADKMASLIRDFLQLGRFDCKKQRLHFGHISASDLIETVTNDLDAIARSKQLSFSVKGDTDIVWFCDAFWMEEILGNILKNCIEHSENGTIHITCKQDANRNQLTITDCGSGLKEGLEQKIFERYSSMTRDNKEGSGLGLSIAQQAMKLHFGIITAGNRPEGGVEFRLSFPQLDDRAIYQNRTGDTAHE